ncbi:MAG TPA: glycerol-3-phosphate 1-O-acyltransferase PlsY [Bryobacteraceae bacterium]|nr:glycerol-3-phosphate 1-O-acyltransferase PlsY [Bryobacteraceae bacterium]
MINLLVLAAAFLIGGIPFGYLLVRLTRGTDVRSMGSGNIGATNVLRTSGGALGILTLLLDIAKGAFAVWLADKLTGGSITWMSLTALAVMFGHAFPVFLKFKGGKAVASFIGAFLYLMPLPLVACLLVFVVVVAISRYISLGSVLATGLFPLAVFLIEHPPGIVLLASAIAGAFIVFRHRANLQRIREGNEYVFAFGSGSRTKRR